MRCRVRTGSQSGIGTAGETPGCHGPVAPPQGARARVLVPGLLLAATLLLAGCGKHGKSAPVGGSTVPPSKINLKRGVELGRAESRSLEYYIETVGVLEAEAQTEIAAGVSGVVDEVLFREGDEVTPETVLVKVDQRRYVTAADVARANEKRAEAQLALATDQAQRAREARAGVSEEDRTRAVLALEVAKADLEAARSQRILAENNLDRSRVRPPYKGRVNQRKVTPGTFIEDKTTIATIADLSRMRLVMWVPETAAATIRSLLAQQDRRVRAAQVTYPLGGWMAGTFPGLYTTAASVRGQVPSGYDPEFDLLAYPQRGFTARIFYLSTVASPETHMFECKAEIDTRHLGVELRPGYTARIRLPLRSNPDAVVIPEESVRATERGFVAFVPSQRVGRDGQTEWVARARVLELGYRSPGWVEVRKGIAPGEAIVRKGAEALEDGTPIRF